MTLVIEVMTRVSPLFWIHFLKLNYQINVCIETDTIGGDRGRDRDRGRLNPRRNDGGPEVGTARGRGIRDGIVSGEVVREIETGRGVTEENVPRGTGIARENGILF